MMKTKQKKSNEKNLHSLETESFMFRSLLKTIPDHIYFKDRQSRFTMLSKALIDWFGANDINDLFGKTDFDIFTGEHAEQAYSDEQELMQTGIPLINKEEKETWEGGKVTWVSTSKVPLKDPGGNIIGLVGISRDITEKKETEANLKRYHESLKSAKRETDNILAHVEEGLFLLGNDLKIGSQYSRELTNILAEKRLSNRNLVNILKKKIDPQTLDALKHYVEILFKDEYDERVLQDLNPLIEVKCQINDGIKYLTFKFKRIKAVSKKITELIVTVTDVTKEVNLIRSLEEEKAENKRKMDWILSIFSTDPKMLKEFITSVQEEMRQVDGALQNLKIDENKIDILNAIYRSLHTIKGNASLLELNFFADEAHKAESIVTEILKKMKILKKDRLNLTNQIDTIHKMYNELSELINQIGKIHEQFRPKRSHEHQQLIRILDKMVSTLSSNYGKKVKFDYHAFEKNPIPHNYRILCRDIIVQLLRNAVFHGIEKPEIRKKLKKPEAGTLIIRGRCDQNLYILELEDDGQGLDLESIKKKAIKLGNWSEDEINGWSRNELRKAIFHPGISTIDSVDLTAGRGVGLNVIKNKLKDVKGKITVESNPGEFTRFKIIVPLK
jgi:two-component system chemotaxis sensor kinase CheA